MNAFLMTQTAVSLLVFAALGGLVMVTMRLLKRVIPHWLAMAHGFLAAAGLTLLLFTAFSVGLSSTAWLGLALLIGAVCVGVVLNLKYQLHGLELPLGLIVVHGVVAAGGLGTIVAGMS